jgi:CheY-like chemotaxis protein
MNLYFPRSDAGSSDVVGARQAADAGGPTRETILVVEDDSRVRQLTIKRLKLIGYEVLEASDGPTALDILQREDAVDLVFTDLIMPGGMSGRDVALRALELKPGIKVLLTSGYAEELMRGDDLKRAGLRVLRKPYQQADLAATLREVLGNGGQAS